MPVTRSSSRPGSQQPSIQPYLSRAGSSASARTKTRKVTSNEIIVLSSEDELPSQGTLLSPKKTSNRSLRKKAVASAAPLVLLSADVLEISSDDGGKPEKPSARGRTRSSETTKKDLQCTIKKLQKELQRSEQLLASASREVEELKLGRSHKDILSGLEEYTLCEVCTSTMWRPYTLPDCGHSFCEDCLVDWFSTTQVQHMAANPQLDSGRAALAAQLHRFIQMVPNFYAYGPDGRCHVRALLAELRRHRPEYTCPSCRKEVLNKPVEDFRLKALIKELAEMMGVTNSRKEICPRRGTSPFEHFFAAPMLTR